jgi:hypothetical protein
MQLESSLCFVRVREQRIATLIEFFDDTVGELQMAGQLPFPPQTKNLCHGQPKQLAVRSTGPEAVN